MTQLHPGVRVEAGDRLMVQLMADEPAYSSTETVILPSGASMTVADMRAWVLAQRQRARVGAR